MAQLHYNSVCLLSSLVSACVFSLFDYLAALPSLRVGLSDVCVASARPCITHTYLAADVKLLEGVDVEDLDA